jgi:hypothetical protein
LLDVTHQAYVGAVVEEPAAWASRYAELLDTTVTFEASSGGKGQPAAGVSLVDNTLALFPLPRNEGKALWGRNYERPRTHVVGLRVPDLAIAEARLARAGVPVVRTRPDMIVLDLAATGEVGIVLVEALLPGDPR